MFFFAAGYVKKYPENLVNPVKKILLKKPILVSLPGEELQ
jgi:hypothetical protein